MFINLFIVALAATTTPLVSAHGKVSVVTGNMGGNTTALGILGAIVPNLGPNSITEIDTTVFSRRRIRSNGLGRTQEQGKNKLSSMLPAAIRLSGGSALPQVSRTNGSISGTFHIVTSDGAGPLKAVLDTTGKGKFGGEGTLELEVLVQVPGEGGFIEPRPQQQQQQEEDDGEGNDGSEKRRSLRWGKRGEEAVNINLDFPMAFKVPDGVNCTGTVDGVEGGNICLVKIANGNAAGPFGGVVAIQMVDSVVVDDDDDDDDDETEPTGSGTPVVVVVEDGAADATTTPTLPGVVIVTPPAEPSTLKVDCEQVVGKVRRWLGF